MKKWQRKISTSLANEFRYTSEYFSDKICYFKLLRQQSLHIKHKQVRGKKRKTIKPRETVSSQY